MEAGWWCDQRARCAREAALTRRSARGPGLRGVASGALREAERVVFGIGDVGDDDAGGDLDRCGDELAARGFDPRAGVAQVVDGEVQADTASGVVRVPGQAEAYASDAKRCPARRGVDDGGTECADVECRGSLHVFDFDAEEGLANDHCMMLRRDPAEAGRYGKGAIAMAELDRLGVADGERFGE